MRARDVLFRYSLRDYSNICTSLSLRWKTLCLTSLCKVTWMSPFSHFTTVVINVLSEPVRSSRSYKSFLLLLLLLGIHAPLCYALHRCKFSNCSGLAFYVQLDWSVPKFSEFSNQLCLEFGTQKAVFLWLLSKTQ